MTPMLRLSCLGTALLVLAGCAGRTRCARPCATPAPREPVFVRTEPAATQAPERQVLIEASLFRIPAARAEEVLGPERGRTARGMGLLTPAAATALVERLAKEAGVTVVHQPAVVSRSGEEASIFVGESYDDTPHRPAGGDAHERALADPLWAGSEFRTTATVLEPGGDLSLDLAFILRDPPPEGTKPDPAALLASQVHARMGIGRMASGASAAIVVAAGDPDRLGDRTLLLVTPRVLPLAGPNPTR